MVYTAESKFEGGAHMGDEKNDAANKSEFALALGTKIKQVRKSKLITITQLSKYTGMSVGYLSNVERGLTSPTVSSLRSICEQLGVRLVDLLEDTSDSRSVIRSDEAFSFEREDFAMSISTFDFGGGMDNFDVITIAPGCEKTDVEALHPYPEICYVIEGTLALEIEGEKLELSAGDAACVKANHHHVMRNDGNQESKSIWYRMTHSAVTTLL